MTSNNSIVISSQATFFEDRFPWKGKDTNTFTKDIGQIWEEPNKDAPENLDNYRNPNIDDLLPEKQTHRPDWRGAFPDPAQPQDPSNDQDNDNKDFKPPFEPKKEEKVMIHLNLQLIGEMLRKKRERQSTFVNVKPLEKKKGNVGRKKLVNLLPVQLLQ